MTYLLSTLSILITLFLIQLIKSSIVSTGVVYDEEGCQRKLYGEYFKSQVWTINPKVIKSVILNGDTLKMWRD